MRGASYSISRTVLPCGIVSTPFPSLTGLGSGLPFDCAQGFPEFTSLFDPHFCGKLPTDRELRYRCATAEYRPKRLAAPIIHAFPRGKSLTPSVIMLTMTIRTCTKHGETKHFPRPGGAFRCGKCSSEWVTRNRRKKKQLLVEKFGGACKLCGYKKYSGALDFHHTNPKNKSFALSVKGLSYSWESLLKEAQKCMLVCKNCHTEIEAGLLKI